MLNEIKVMMFIKDAGKIILKVTFCIKARIKRPYGTCVIWVRYFSTHKAFRWNAGVAQM